MIDIFAILLHHGLMLLAVWRLINRDDLDADPLLPMKRSDQFHRKPRGTDPAATG